MADKFFCYPHVCARECSFDNALAVDRMGLGATDKAVRAWITCRWFGLIGDTDPVRLKELAEEAADASAAPARVYIQVLRCGGIR